MTAQIDETTLCGINYKNKPLSNIEELLNLAMDNFTDLDSIALPLLNPDNLKIDLEEAISSNTSFDKTYTSKFILDILLTVFYLDFGQY